MPRADLLKAADRMAKWIDRLEDQDANGGNKWYVMSHAVNARIAYETLRHEREIFDGRSTSFKTKV